MTSDRDYSGRFNLRIPTQLHERLALRAQASTKSLIAYAQEALDRSLAAAAKG